MEENIDMEIIDIEMDAAFPYIASDGQIENHSQLNGRELSNQHPFEAIYDIDTKKNLKETLSDIEAVKRIYAKGSSFAEFKKWNDSNPPDITERVGCFVYIVPNSDTIAICGDSNEVYGVTTMDAGFVGNQVEADRTSDKSYAMVSILGAVKVRADKTVRTGDYVVPNAYGEATISENNYGYKVLSMGSSPEYNYAVIALTPQSSTLNKILGSLSDTQLSVGDILIELDSVKNTANSAAGNAQIAIDTSKMTAEEIEEIFKELEDQQEQITNATQIVEDTKAQAEQASTIATSAQSSAAEAYLAAQSAKEDANSVVSRISDVEGNVSAVVQRVDQIDSVIGNSDGTLSSIQQQVNDNTASINLINTGRFTRVYAEFEEVPPEPYEGQQKYSKPPVWDDELNAFVFNESFVDEHGTYYFDTADHSRYCCVTDKGYIIYIIDKKATSLINSRIDDTNARIDLMAEFGTDTTEVIAGLSSRVDENEANISLITSRSDYKENVYTEEVTVYGEKHCAAPEWDSVENKYVFKPQDRDENGVYYMADENGQSYCKVVTADDGTVLYEVYRFVGNTIAALQQQVDDVSASIGMVVDDNGVKGSVIIQAINDQSIATISADRVNLNGYLTISNLNEELEKTSTTIDGNHITTNTITLEHLNFTPVSAEDIEEGIDSAVDASIDSAIGGMTLTATNGEKSSTITLTYGDISIVSNEIQFQGEVVFKSDLSTEYDPENPESSEDVTLIHGSRIITGTLSSDLVDTSYIVAKDGTIGAFSIDDDSIHTIGKNYFGKATQGVYIGPDGIDLGDDEYYIRLYNDGTLQANHIDVKGGTIGGFTIMSNALMSIQDGFTMILGASFGLSLEGPDGEMYLGSDGRLHATNADISGYIKATDGIFKGTIYATDGEFTGTIKAGSILSENISFWDSGISISAGDGLLSLGNLFNMLMFDEDKTVLSGYTYFSEHFDTYLNPKIILGEFTYVNTGTFACVINAHKTGLLAGTWSATSAISTTSDMNVKNSIEDIDNKYSELFDNLQPRIFKYNDGTSNRYHTGFIAQEVKDAMDSANVNTTEFAALVIQEREEELRYWSLRYEEFIALNTREIQKLKARVAELEAMVKGE